MDRLSIRRVVLLANGHMGEYKMMTFEELCNAIDGLLIKTSNKSVVSKDDKTVDEVFFRQKSFSS